MDEVARKAIGELEERVAELERKLQMVMNSEQSWSEERVEDIPTEIFGLLVVYLSALDIDFSVERFRQFVNDTKLKALDRLEEQASDHVLKTMFGWEKMITRHFMTSMIPAAEDEAQLGEHEPRS